MLRCQKIRDQLEMGKGSKFSEILKKSMKIFLKEKRNQEVTNEEDWKAKEKSHNVSCGLGLNHNSVLRILLFLSEHTSSKETHKAVKEKSLNEFKKC